LNRVVTLPRNHADRIVFGLGVGFPSGFWSVPIRQRCYGAGSGIGFIIQILVVLPIFFFEEILPKISDTMVDIITIGFTGPLVIIFVVTTRQRMSEELLSLAVIC